MRELLRGKEVAVVGGGAVGAVISYALNLNGIIPRIICRSRDKALKIRREGLKLLLPDGGEATVKAEYVDYDSVPEASIDVAFIAVKAYDVREASRRLKRLLKGKALVITCQNGLWSAETVRSIVSKDNVVAVAVLNLGAYRVGREVRLTGVGVSYIGVLTGLNHPVIYEVAEALSYLKFKVVQNINGYRWVKLGVNAGINPVTAILRIKNGELLRNKHALSLAISAAAEVSRIARAAGIKLPQDPVNVLIGVAKVTSDNYSSMLQDVMAGRRTEVDYINGAAYVESLKYGVKASVNHFLWRLVKAIEEARPG